MTDIIIFKPRVKMHGRLPLPDNALVPVRAAAPNGPGRPALQILIAIAAHVDGDGCAYASMTRLAEVTGINRGHIASLIKELEEYSLISRERRRRPNGSLTTNRYTLLHQGAG